MILKLSLTRISSCATIVSVRGFKVKFSNGVEMPIVGLGTWQSTQAEAKTAVHSAIDVGYRLIDTAAVYGNEVPIGEAIKEAIDAGKIKRDELFVTTKLWTNHLSPKDSMQAAKDSLSRLGLEYVDLYLAHMPAAYTTDKSRQDHSVTVQDIWGGLETIYEAKMARAIGVSNWSAEQIDRVMNIAKIPIHNNQVELHLYWPQHELHEICEKHNIVVTSYASLGSPGRMNQDRLPSGGKRHWAPAPSALEDKNVVALAKRHNKTPAQILLRYCLDRGVAIIPKSSNPQRIKENFNLFDFKLSPDEIRTLESAPHRQRLFLQDYLQGHPEDPFKNERK